ncbi:ligase-associated DNA damage response endonuclease PdeM [Falsigemmobacter faecalis]|uniref:Ligase-associated DNA damage response endonuclease PdeM n=1 Tax=Falsigemmobacter faecalis TaxID=2488730 RepID=A0A3P3DTM1_9RHOB|nr:ligase-associated DNA damage response endonuclease PdeM [Falsigemmobacter faecalis]RRH77294.1 ligase-associated DNA damage response endonuclease PdeM [Falsigemmobacter faecalis]
MGDFSFRFNGLRVIARPSGALWLPESRSLTVSDLHLGRATRMARLRHQLLPPYETAETLRRLQAEIKALNPARVISLGDSFDDSPAMAELNPPDLALLHDLIAGRDWIWIRGNHDPVAENPPFGGRFCDDWQEGDSPVWRHIRLDGGADISGHLHPVVPLGGRRWRAFLVSRRHLILPAFGAYTGGLEISDPAFDGWLRPGHALLCASRIMELPLP